MLKIIWLTFKSPMSYIRDEDLRNLSKAKKRAAPVTHLAILYAVVIIILC
jgi:hypothetical protein